MSFLPSNTDAQFIGTPTSLLQHFRDSTSTCKFIPKHQLRFLAATQHTQCDQHHEIPPITPHNGHANPNKLTSATPQASTPKLRSTTMASILRQIVASPRVRHTEADLDLCYVTDNIIATSGPGATYPQVAYRNPLKDLVKFLDRKHGDKWCIWEFRAEGTGYPDVEVYGRVRHYPWPDHHPPPFALIPLIMGSMRNWLREKSVEGRVVVVHCKAGKGRSGTVSCSYLISEEGWTPEDAMARFTERRMRQGFGVGISIPSQQRWISYVDRWTKCGKVYVERPVEILEVHCWGLRDGVKIVIEGFVEEGKVIKKFHTFTRSERTIVRGEIQKENGFADAVVSVLGRKKTIKDKKVAAVVEDAQKQSDMGVESASKTSLDSQSDRSSKESQGGDVIFKPSSRVILPSSDVNIDVERRNKTNLGGLTMVTSVGHVWINTFFEGNGPEQDGKPDDSGVFEIEWDAMDGIKGSSRKGTASFDRIAIVWKAVPLDPHKPSVVINEPAEGEEVRQTEAADWRGRDKDKSDPDALTHKLGLRAKTSDSASVSPASSMREQKEESDRYGSAEELAGVKAHGLGDRETLIGDEMKDAEKGKAEPKATPADLDDKTMEVDGVKDLIARTKHLSTEELPYGVPEGQMKEHNEHAIGNLGPKKKTSS